MNKVKTHYPIITISNFKRFSKPIEFELKPITILVGPNGSGKSTVIEALNIFSKSLRVFSKSEESSDFLNNYSFEELISDKTKKRFEFSACSQFGSIAEITEEIKITISYKNGDGNPVFDLVKFEKEKMTMDKNTSDRKKFGLKFYLGSSRKYGLIEFEDIIEAVKSDLPTTFLEEIVHNKEEIEKIISFGLVIYKVDCSFLVEKTDEEKIIMALAYGILTHNFFYNEYVKDKNILTMLVYLVYRNRNVEDHTTFIEVSKLCEDAFENFKTIRSSFDEVETNIGTEDLMDETRE